MIRNQSCSISSRGSELDDRNRKTKKQREHALDRLAGAGPQPDERAQRGERERDQHRQHHQHDHAADAGLEVQPGREADRQVDEATEISATTSTPLRCPSSIAERCIGVSASRFRKPVSTSRATALPALIDANSEPWMNGNAIAKSR